MRMTIKEHKLVQVATFDVELPELPDGWVYDYNDATSYFMMKREDEDGWRACCYHGKLSLATSIPIDVLRIFVEACQVFSDAIVQHGKLTTT